MEFGWKLTKNVVTVPAEFPETSLICIWTVANKYSFLDWKPEPELLSKLSIRSSLLLSIWPRPSPQVMSMKFSKSLANETWKEQKKTQTTTNPAIMFEEEEDKYSGFMVGGETSTINGEEWSMENGIYMGIWRK